MPMDTQEIDDSNKKVHDREIIAENFEQSSKSADPAGFQFLNFTNFKQTTNAETKKKVRSHAQHQVQQILRASKPRGKTREFVLDTSSLVQNQPESSIHQTSQFAKSPNLALAALPHPSNIGSGRSNPFVKYPVDMDLRAHELLDHLHGNTCPMFKTMSQLGFFQIVEDDAGFRQILCTSSAHMTSLLSGGESLEALTLSAQAIQSLNRRLADPALEIDDGVIITIIAFACHTIMFKDYSSSLTYFYALEGIIRPRGGLKPLVASPIVRIMVFWLDVNSAFLEDRAPRFQCPIDILPSIDAVYSIPDSAEILFRSCVTDRLANAVGALFATIRFMVIELADKDWLDNGIFAGLYVMPMLDKFLSTKITPAPNYHASMREEACRLGVILYLAAVRQKFGIFLPTGPYISQLKNYILAWNASDIEGSDRILLWLLVLGGIQSFSHEEHLWFVSTTTHHISKLRYGSWEAVVALVSAVLWTPGAFETECEEFHKEVTANWQGLYGHVLS